MNYRVRPFRLGPYIRTKPLSSAKTEKGAGRSRRPLMALVRGQIL